MPFSAAHGIVPRDVQIHPLAVEGHRVPGVGDLILPFPGRTAHHGAGLPGKVEQQLCRRRIPCAYRGAADQRAVGGFGIGALAVVAQLADGVVQIEFPGLGIPLGGCGHDLPALFDQGAGHGVRAAGAYGIHGKQHGTGARLAVGIFGACAQDLRIFEPNGLKHLRKRSFSELGKQNFFVVVYEPVIHRTVRLPHHRREGGVIHTANVIIHVVRFAERRAGRGRRPAKAAYQQPDALPRAAPQQHEREHDRKDPQKLSLHLYLPVKGLLIDLTTDCRLPNQLITEISGDRSRKAARRGA